MILPNYADHTSIGRRQRATVLHQLSSVIFAIIALAGITLASTIASGDELGIEILLVCVTCCCAVLIAFILNRAGHYESASMILLLVTWLIPYIVGYTMSDIEPELHQIHWAALTSVMLMSILFPKQRMILGIGLLNAVSIIILHRILGDLTVTHLFSPMLGFIMVTICTMVIHSHRTQLENERKAELVVVNADLKHQVNERERLTQGLTQILSAADELLTTPTLDAMWKRGVELARERLGMDRCAIYEFNPATGEMTGTYGTDLTGATVSEHTTTFKLAESPWSKIEFKSDKRWVVQYDAELLEGCDRHEGLAKGWNAFTSISASNGKLAAIMFSDNVLSSRPFVTADQDLVSIYCTLLGGIGERKKSGAQRDQQQAQLAIANSLLQQQMSERERLTNGLTAILSATDILLATPDLDTLWKRAVDLTHERLGAERCAIYEFDPATQTLVGTYGISMSGATISEHGKCFSLAEADGMTAAFASKAEKPWIMLPNTDLYDYADGINRVAARGWSTITLISNRAGVPSAILFCDSAISSQPFDPIQQDLIGVYASLLSGIIERKRAEAQRDAQQLDIQESNARLIQEVAEREQLTQGLTTILGATNELMAVPNLDQLWQRGVELARERLHLERCSIFEIDAEKGEMTGTYGTASDGGTTTEYDKLLKISETHWSDLLDPDHEQRSWIVKQNIDLHEFSNGVNRTIAWGWLACARITDKNGLPSAVLFHDSALTGRPFDPVEQDLIGLYCSLLGGIIERKRAEMQLEENLKELKVAKRMAEESSRIKSEFLSTVSHELRTPLNAIIGFSDMLLMGMSGDMNSKQHHKMTRLRENGLRLLTLINNVLDLTRLEARRVEIVNKPFFPHDLVKRISAQVEVLAQQKGLTLNIHIDAATPSPLLGDEERIEQVVVNLLSNAFKFTEKGSVTLTLDAQPTANTWRIRVADTGIGIPPHAFNMIFEEFRQVDGGFNRAYKGSGLGLSITHNLVQLMNGHIAVESTLGTGSTFIVTFPLLSKSTDNIQNQLSAAVKAL